MDGPTVEIEDAPRVFWEIVLLDNTVDVHAKYLIDILMGIGKAVQVSLVKISNEATAHLLAGL